MKSRIQIQRVVTQLAFAITLTGISLLSISALAQEKGGAALMGLNRQPTTHVSQPAAPAGVAKTCPMCENVVKVIPDTSVKGGEVLINGARPGITLMEHKCPLCSDRYAVVGLGKGAHMIFQHTCTACGEKIKSCCVTAGNSK
jgi:hypothetical protein